LTATVLPASTSLRVLAPTSAGNWRPFSRAGKGEPMEIVSNLVTRWLPTQTTRIDVQEQGDTVNATVGNFGQVQSQRLRNEAGQPMTMQNVGFAAVFQLDNQTGELALGSGTRWSDPDMPRPFVSKSGVVAGFRWGGS
jgi:hypothetical protein